MKTSLFIVLIVCSHVAMSQKCMFTRQGMDSFSGEKINSITHTNSGWTWSSVKKGDKYFIEMTFLHAGELKISMTKKDSMLIKLENGEVLTLFPAREVLPAPATIGNDTDPDNIGPAIRRTVTSYSPAFEVSKQVFETLSKSPLLAIRFSFTELPFDFDFTRRPLKRSTNNIIRQATCILAVD
ncbi:MAG: hypothetical protein J0L67_07715 [Cytophagales bacterium]|nr:hypothetical protein [Cytophagales bacterium]